MNELDKLMKGREMFYIFLQKTKHELIQLQVYKKKR